MALLPRSTRMTPTLPATHAPRPLHRAEFEVPAERSSVCVARHLLAEWLRRWHCPPDVVDTAQLVVSEFVTNAVVHTVSDRIVCCLLHGEHRVRIEVCDQGTGAPGLAAHSAGVEATNGRGLQLVDALADAWGDGRGPRAQGRVVWAELRLPNA